MAKTPTTVVLEDLIARFRAGDAEAKDALINRAYNRLLVLARGHLRRFPGVRKEEETAAVLSESYQRVNKALDDVRPATVRDFFGLAALQIRRALLDLSRKGRRGAEPRPAVVGGLGAPGDGSGGGGGGLIVDPEPDGGRIGLRDDILAALDVLSDEQREAVELIFFNGLTQAEAAEILDVHEDTVKRRWAAARVKLADLLDDYAPPE